jgi:hypothetical protein
MIPPILCDSCRKPIDAPEVVIATADYKMFRKRVSEVMMQLEDSLKRLEAVQGADAQLTQLTRSLQPLREVVADKRVTKDKLYNTLRTFLGEMDR